CGLFVLLARAPNDGERRFAETWAVRLLLTEALLVLMLLVVPYLLEVVRDYGAHVRDPSPAAPATKPALPVITAGSLTSLLVAVLLQVRAKATEPAEVLHAAKGVRNFFRRLAPRLRLLFTYLPGAAAGPTVLLPILPPGA